MENLYDELKRLESCGFHLEGGAHYVTLTKYNTYRACLMSGRIPADLLHRMEEEAIGPAPDTVDSMSAEVVFDTVRMNILMDVFTDRFAWNVRGYACFREDEKIIRAATKKVAMGMLAALDEFTPCATIIVDYAFSINGYVYVIMEEIDLLAPRYD